jgi:hypothetical protein
MYILLSVLLRHSAKRLFAVCLGLGTRQRLTPLTTITSWRAFAECHPLPSARHSAKYSLPSVLLCRVPDTRQRMNLPCVFFCRVLHSAKRIFAECLIFCARQISGHSAKSSFPVVMHAYLMSWCALDLICIYKVHEHQQCLLLGPMRNLLLRHRVLGTHGVLVLG